MSIRRQAAGFTLPGVLVGISLSLVTLAMSVPIFHWCTIGLHNSQTAAATAASFDHALDLLRRDVWQAQKIQQPSPDRLVLSSPAGPITWQFNADGTLIRRPPTGGEQHWQPGLGRIGVDQTGAIVTVTVPNSPGRAGYVLGMASPLSPNPEGRP